jgi:uncharacterized protein YbjQ (UPF0145 family)
MNDEHAGSGESSSDARTAQPDDKASPSSQAPNPLHPTQLPPAPGWPLHPAMVTSALVLPGFEIARSHGIVRGLSVRSTGITGGFAAVGQALGGGGGSVQTVVELNEQAHGEALFIMLQHAAQLGANAVIGFCYNSTDQVSIVTVLTYGTAVWAEQQ